MKRIPRIHFVAPRFRLSGTLRPALLSAVGIAYLFLACTHDPVSSGGAGAETTNGIISARVLDPNGAPIIGANVAVSPDTLLILDTNSITEPAIWPRHTVTDSTGLFSFDSLPTDTYSIEVVTPDGRGVHFRTAVGPNADQIVHGDELLAQPLLEVRGSVSRDYIDSGIVLRIGIYGLNRVVEIPKGEYFSIDDIPPGTYQAVVTSSLPHVTGSEVFEITASEENPSTWNHVPALPIVRHHDSLKIAAYLRAQGIPTSAWDSVTGTFSKRVYRLDLRRRGIHTIHPSIGNLHMLWNVDLGENPLSALPVELKGMENLRWLHLDSIPVEQVWSDLIEMKQLTSLSLSKNSLTALPPGLSALEKLGHLTLNRNRLDSVPTEVFACSGLTELSLSHNSLDSLSPEISRLTRLKILDISDNQLSAIPVEVGALVSLERLLISGNALSRLPDELGNCTELTRILAGGNNLTAVPASIGDLENLIHLSLKGNLLEQLPSSFVSLRLHFLNVNDNRLCNVPSELRAWIDVVSSDSDWESRQDCR